MKTIFNARLRAVAFSCVALAFFGCAAPSQFQQTKTADDFYASDAQLTPSASRVASTQSIHPLPPLVPTDGVLGIPIPQLADRPVEVPNSPEKKLVRREFDELFYTAGPMYGCDQTGSSVSQTPFSQCTNKIEKTAIDACVYISYHRQGLEELSSLGLTGVAIAAGAAGGLSALFHASGATTTAITAGVATIGTLATTAKGAIPQTGSTPVTGMQNTAQAYLEASAPNYGLPPDAAKDIFEAQNRVKAAGNKAAAGDKATASISYFCSPSFAIADGSDLDKWKDMSCNVPWTVSPAGAPARYQPSKVNVGATWDEAQYASFYDAIFSTCPALTL